MNYMFEEFSITLKYQVKVNTDTGEMTTKCISRKIDKSNFEISEAKRSNKKIDESTEPQLILETNKYCLNNAAIQLMNLKADDRLEIKYEKQENTIIPIIGTVEAFHISGGNRLTKSNTVAFRGNKNKELSEYGTTFSITPYKDGLFCLKGNKEIVEQQGDENIVEPDINDFADLVDNTEEVDSSFFQL